MRNARLRAACIGSDRFALSVPEHLLDATQRLAGPLFVLNQGEPHMAVAMLSKPHARD